MMDAWLPLFPGKYVGLSYGTNDANSPGNLSQATTDFYNNVKSMAQKVIAAGKVPVIPTIPWARDSNYETYIPAFNAKIAQLYLDVPQIVHGPDLHAYFSSHQDQIRGDDLHPTAAGFAAYRQLWATAMLSAVYNGVTPPDTSSPTVSLTSPANGASVSGSATITASASDDVGVAGVQFRLDGAVLGAEDTASPYSISWDTTSASNGTHTLTAKARDAAGNAKTSAAVTVIVSNVIPDTMPPARPRGLRLQ